MKIATVSFFLLFRTFQVPFCIAYMLSRENGLEKFVQMSPFVFWFVVAGLGVLGSMNFLWTYIILKKYWREFQKWTLHESKKTFTLLVEEKQRNQK